jgi:YHS domain-containing protein
VSFDVARRVRKEEVMATDPVCGLKVDEKNAPASATYAGKPVYFCSNECKEMFLKNPEAYAAQLAKA